MYNILLFTLFFPLIYSLDGPHVCTKVEEYPIEVKVTTHVPFKVRTYTWCTKIPFRCSKERIDYRIGNKLETRLQNRTVQVCCKGHTEVADRCIPVCSNVCIYGICVAPEICECHPGWGGSTCNTTCPLGKWGTKCEQNCNCINNAKCDSVDGRCNCLPGTWGTGCKNVCTCRNGDCNSITGECSCYPGWKGDHCDEACEHNTYGYYCSQNCTCNQSSTVTCRFSDGLCVCKDGYQGHDCSDLCDDGYFGHKCAHRCQCNSPNYKCDPVVGCKCRFENTNDQNCRDHIISSGLYHRISDDAISRTSSWSSFMIVIALISLIMLTLAMAIIYRYKKKLNRLKSDLAYVTYVSERGNDQFDNPVYSYQTSGHSAGQSCAIVTSASINPTTCGFSTGTGKTFGIDKKLVAYMEETETNGYQVSSKGHPETPPPKYSETDVTLADGFSSKQIIDDPNIYTDIDDVKLEMNQLMYGKSSSMPRKNHYYDEIVGDKHCKMGRMDEEEVDLDTPVPLPGQCANDLPTINDYENISQHYDKPKSTKIVEQLSNNYSKANNKFDKKFTK